MINNELTLEEIKHQYKCLFEGIGELPGEYDIKIQEDANPVIHPPRKVPVLIKE